MKKIVCIGGGTGLSTLLRGLKQFPVDITAIVAVSDDGRSTGMLRKEFNIPAVGDIRQVIASLSETEPLIKELINYRFKTNGNLNNHSLGNLLLTALINVTGSLSCGIESLEKILKLKGKILPLTEENTTLIAKMADGKIIEGEHNITEYNSEIINLYYEHPPVIVKKVLEEIESADLIVISMGSLYTSILPNLLSKDVIKSIDKSNAKIMYVCNLFTQPGETDNYTASDHVKTINKYLGKKKVNSILINNGKISTSLKNKYIEQEKKNPVIFDKENLKALNLKIISDDFIEIVDGTIKHNSIKIGFYIYSNLMF